MPQTLSPMTLGVPKPHPKLPKVSLFHQPFTPHSWRQRKPDCMDKPWLGSQAKELGDFLLEHLWKMNSLFFPPCVPIHSCWTHPSVSCLGRSSVCCVQNPLKKATRQSCPIMALDVLWDHTIKRVIFVLFSPKIILHTLQKGFSWAIFLKIILKNYLDYCRISWRPLILLSTETIRFQKLFRKPCLE